LLDQTLPPEKDVDGDLAESFEEKSKINGIVAEGDPWTVFAEERPGWKGYIEWEEFPEKRAKAAALLAQHTFPPPPEFQLEPVPEGNSILDGERWKLWHKAVGGPLTAVPEESWLRVVEEKHPDMLHLLEFPYNGEPPKRLVTAKPITPNPLHFVRNHGGIPDIDASKFFLQLDGLVKNPQALTLAGLQNESVFPRQTHIVTIQCSGTRRIEQINEYAGEGDEMINAPWAEGAIGTAKWTGVSLKRVIKHCGGLVDDAKHLELYGCETYFKQARTHGT
jgi:sulfite oxidase